MEILRKQNQELHGKGEKEEEIELEDGDVNLVLLLVLRKSQDPDQTHLEDHVSSSKLQISADMLINRPCEFVV